MKFVPWDYWLENNIKTRHPYQIIHFNGGRAKIDELLVPVITKLWGLGRYTQFSCQGDLLSDIKRSFDIGYIMFLEPKDRDWFWDKCYIGEKHWVKDGDDLVRFPQEDIDRIVESLNKV
jgi:hypothetical protein